MGVPYDPARPDLGAVRLIFFDWLRANPKRNQLSKNGGEYEPFVDYAGGADREALAFHVTEVFWQLLVEGIVAPGMNHSNMELPWFHVTEYGKRVLQEEAGHPYDPSGYLARLRRHVPVTDDTVMAYLGESLSAFQRGSQVASAVMLGIAAERVFLLVCDQMHSSIADPQEKAGFAALLARFQMKPKLDWIHAKLTDLQNRRVKGFPENTTLMIGAIYDLLRAQRNDLGHPRETPPALDRDEAFASLQVFPRFYATAEKLRQFLTANQV